MKEYGIFIICNGGTPYMLHIYDNITAAKLKLYDLVSLEEERGRQYFVDNDFFDNKYPNCGKIKYFCIKEREVTEYIKYSDTLEKKNEENKIIYFQNFLKNC